MQRNHRHVEAGPARTRSNRHLLLPFTAALAGALACSDSTTSPPGIASATSGPEDIQTVLWRKSGDSLLLVHASQASLSRTPDGHFSVRATREIADRVAIHNLSASVAANLPTLAAARASQAGGIPLNGAANASRSAGKTRITWSTKVVRGRTPDGQEIRVALVGDQSGKGPLAATVTYIGGRLAYVSEMQHEQIKGKSRLRRMRTTTFGADGAPSLVSDADMGDARRVAANASIIGTLGARGLALIPRLARLVEPDALHAQSLQDDQCAPLAVAVGVTSALAATAVLVAAAKATALAAAVAALTAAQAALCATTPLICAATITALTAAVAVAKLEVAASEIAAAAALVSAGVAAAALFECLNSAPTVPTLPSIPAPGPGSGGGGPGDGEAVQPPPSSTPCYVYAEWDDAGNITRIDDLYGCLN